MNSRQNNGQKDRVSQNQNNKKTERAKGQNKVGKRISQNQNKKKTK